MREPLPLPVKTACAYAEAVHQQRGGTLSPLERARKEWETDRFSPYGIRGEDADPAHLQVYGENAPIQCLLTQPRPDEQWNTEQHRLGRLAVRLWEPLLSGAEKVGHL
jgi:exodeoxyribonuclease V gamma subunit